MITPKDMTLHSRYKTTPNKLTEEQHHALSLP